jgi:hypothetical protein
LTRNKDILKRRQNKLKRRVLKRAYDNEKRIFVDVRQAERKFCLSPFELNQGPKYSPLMRDYSSKNCSYLGKFNYDKSFKRIDSHKKIEWFAENSMLLAKELPFNKDPKAKIYIYSRGYIGISYDCIQEDFTPDTFIETFKKLFYAYDSFPLINSIALSSAVLQFVFLMIKRKYDEDNGFSTLFIYFIVEIGISSAALFGSIVAMNSYHNMGNSMNYINQFSSLNCADEMIITAIEGFKTFSINNTLISLLMAMNLLFITCLYSLTLLINSFRR